MIRTRLRDPDKVRRHSLDCRTGYQTCLSAAILGPDTYSILSASTQLAIQNLSEMRLAPAYVFDCVRGDYTGFLFIPTRERTHLGRCADMRGCVPIFPASLFSLWFGLVLTHSSFVASSIIYHPRPIHLRSWQ